MVYLFWTIILLSSIYGFVLIIPGLAFVFSKKSDPIGISKNSGKRTFVSILVPVRNEEKTIGECLKSLSLLNYPRELFEIILIDDHSTDETLEIAKHFGKDFHSLSILKNDPDSIGKKRALTVGVRAAKGELIVTTDGDCIVPVNWIKIIVSVYENEQAAFIAGPVAYVKKSGLLRQLLQIEQIVLQLVSGGSMEMGFPMMCSGANLAYKKDFFMEVGGYENDQYASGDDMMLMQKAQKIAPGKLKFISDHKALVVTKPANNLSEAIQQRSRWISKFSTFKNVWITGTGMVVFLANFFVVFLGLFSIGNHLFVEPFIWTFCLKMLIDLLLLSLAVPFFREPHLLLFALLEEIFYPFLVLVSAIAKLSGSFSWKGRNWKT